jgi:hypothetical protein
MAISLIMMAAVSQLLATIGNSVAAARASITQAEALRAVRNRLQSDLTGVTAPTVPLITSPIRIPRTRCRPASTH